jgi:uncharacterized protein YukE
MAEPVGLDPVAMNDLAAKFTAAQAVLNGSRSAVQQSINQAWWAGAAADRFRSEWNTTLSGQLRTCTDNLALAATDLKRQRQQQITTSSDGITIGSVSIPTGLVGVSGGVAGGSGGGPSNGLPEAANDDKDARAKIDQLKAFDTGGTKTVEGEFVDKAGKIQKYKYTVTTVADKDGNLVSTTKGINEKGETVSEVKTEPRSKTDGNVAVSTTLAEGQAFFGKQAQGGGEFNLFGQPGKYDGSASAGAFVAGDVKVGFDDGNATAEAGASVGITAQVAGSAGLVVGSGLLQTDLKAKGAVSVGAQGNVDAKFHAGKDGIGLDTGADAFVGVQGNAEISGEIAGVKASAGVGGSIGLGAHAKIESNFSATKVKLGVDVGAAIGIGGNLKFKVEINPKKTVSKIYHSIGSLFD